eukprot:173930-Pleurochrysis_carterae.AAC.1
MRVEVGTCRDNLPRQLGTNPFCGGRGSKPMRLFVSVSTCAHAAQSGVRLESSSIAVLAPDDWVAGRPEDCAEERRRSSWIDGRVHVRCRDTNETEVEVIHGYIEPQAERYKEGYSKTQRYREPYTETQTQTQTQTQTHRHIERAGGGKKSTKVRE